MFIAAAAVVLCRLKVKKPADVFIMFSQGSRDGEEISTGSSQHKLSHRLHETATGNQGPSGKKEESLAGALSPQPAHTSEQKASTEVK